MKEGYIYLLENKIGENILYKIGYTKDLNKRLKQLETGNPGEMKIIKSFETRWGRILESIIHKIYINKKIKNEWFNLNNEQVNNFLNNCKITENNLNIIKENHFFKKKYNL